MARRADDLRAHHLAAGRSIADAARLSGIGEHTARRRLAARAPDALGAAITDVLATNSAQDKRHCFRCGGC